MSRSDNSRLWLLLDLLASAAGFGLMTWLFDRLSIETGLDLWLPKRAPGLFITAVIFWLAMLGGNHGGGPGLAQRVRKFLTAWGSALIAQSAMVYLLRAEPLPASAILGGAILALVLAGGARKCFYSAAAAGRERVLFLGFDPVAGVLARFLGPAVAGVLHGEPAEVPADIPYLGEPARLAEVVASTRPARIIVSGAEERFPVPPRLLLELRIAGIAIDDGMASYEAFFGRVYWRRMETSTLLFSPSLATHKLVMSVQSIYTDLTGLALLAAALPLLFAAAVAVALFSGRGPVLEYVECLGFQGIPFRMLRFRTRRKNGGTTRIGRLLGRLHAVDLPQLINVVRGEMAFIGPPPVRREFAIRLAQLMPFYAPRFTVKPGMLGWSQSNLAGCTSVPDEALRLEYDLYYVQEVIPALDFEIMIRSIFRTRMPVARPMPREGIV